MGAGGLGRRSGLYCELKMIDASCCVMLQAVCDGAHPRVRRREGVELKRVND